MPPSVYKKECLFSDNENKEWASNVLRIEKTLKHSGREQWWDKSTFTTAATNAIEVGHFTDLLEAVTEHVKTLSRKDGLTEELNVLHSWANVAREGDRQDYHSHPDSIFSAVYYVKVPTGSSNIIFQEPDIQSIEDISEDNDSVMNAQEYEVKEGMLIIFKSSLRHRVPEGLNTDPRISIAMNFGYV